MKQLLVLSFLINVINAQSQQLSCCTSEAQARVFITGEWEKINEDEKQYHFEFGDKGEGRASIYRNKNSELIENSFASILVIKLTNGYELVYDWGGITTRFNIKKLNSSELILERNDGKRSVFRRISSFKKAH